MEMNRQLKGETGSMTQQTITAEMTVFAVLDRVPGAIELFQQHGVNPAGECAFFTRQIRLKETPERCHVEDLDGLIFELNAAIQMGALPNE
ncbi:MAG: hypothetical protein M9930_20370 [Anaerolineae bacterium]|nr:hypothetical protein [Anaerolineae bacterium]